MAYNKVVFANETLIDLTSDTVQASDVQSGKYYTGPDGVRRQGTSTKDANTTDADALASNILYGQTAYAQGNKITGSMANQGSITRTIGTKDSYAVIPGGYHDGGGKVSIASAEQAKIIPGNIKSGSVIMGVTGTYTGEDPIIQENKSIGAEVTDETIDITPDDGYEGMEQVTIYPITYELTPNAAGGNTCTIVDGEVPDPTPTAAGAYLGDWPNSFTQAGLKLYNQNTGEEITSKYEQITPYPGQTTAKIRVDDAGAEDHDWYTTHVEVIGTPVGHSHPYGFQPTFTQWADGWVMNIETHSDTYGDYNVIVNFH